MSPIVPKKKGSADVADRKGEKIGWTVGWFGGFIWVAGLSAIFLFQEKWLQGLLGLLLVIVAFVSVIFFAPWRHPSTHYWKLMICPYGALFTSLIWAVWSYGGAKAAGLNWWNIFLLLLLLIPFRSFYKRKWSDFNGRQSSADADKPSADLNR